MNAVYRRRLSDTSRPIATALADLRLLPYAGRIVVFGSMGRGEPWPADIDLAIVLDDGEAPPMDLIALARRHYGLIDPFARMHRGRLLVRSDEATHWQPARSVRAIDEGIRRDGRPLAEIDFRP